MIEGLGPYPQMRDSGVAWLGAVPAHWEVLRIKRLARLQSGDSITAERINSKGLYPVFGGNGVRGYTSTYTHQGDYVLIGRQGALCGNINYASGKFYASEHAVVCSSAHALYCALVWRGTEGLEPRSVFLGRCTTTD